MCAYVEISNEINISNTEYSLNWRLKSLCEILYVIWFSLPNQAEAVYDELKTIKNNCLKSSSEFWCASQSIVNSDFVWYKIWNDFYKTGLWAALEAHKKLAYFKSMTHLKISRILLVDSYLFFLLHHLELHQIDGVSSFYFVSNQFPCSFFLKKKKINELCL